MAHFVKAGAYEKWITLPTRERWMLGDGYGGGSVRPQISICSPARLGASDGRRDLFETGLISARFRRDTRLSQPSHLFTCS